MILPKYLLIHYLIPILSISSTLEHQSPIKSLELASIRSQTPQANKVSNLATYSVLEEHRLTPSMKIKTLMSQGPYKVTSTSNLGCTLTLAPSVTHTEAVATLAITVGNGLPLDSSLTLAFPTTWENSVSSTYKPVMHSTTICSKVSGASLAPTLSCSILSGALTSQIGIDSAFSSAIAAS